MNQKIWLSHYPQGVPATLDFANSGTLADMMRQSFERYGARAACHFMGRDLTYAQWQARSQRLAAWLQQRGLQAGDRVLLMMPNLPQYLIAVAAVLQAGLVLVGASPRHTPKDLTHQLQDSGARAIILAENFAAVLQACPPQVRPEHVIITGVGDELGPIKGRLINQALRRDKRRVPPYDLPGAASWRQVLRQGARLNFAPPDIQADDLAALQYTGGTTGTPAAAMLLHRNLMANVLQSEAWYQPALQQIPAGDQPTLVAILPLYHAFAFTVCLLLSIHTGGRLILIGNPLDLPAVIKTLSRQRFHTLPAVSTLFNALASQPDLDRIDFSHLKISVAGGASVPQAVAARWQARTGQPLCEGYGLSEASPAVSCNLVTAAQFSGHVGLPLPGTDIKLVDDSGQTLPLGQVGEILVKGPQVMAGYWQKPDQTRAVMTPDGYLKTGDLGVMDERGQLRIVDRKKDLIIVNGINVYPNEIEDVVCTLPGVQQAAAIGVPNARLGEAVKLFVVRQDPDLDEQTVRKFCREHLSAHKRPRIIEFRKNLPLSPVGKVLRRALRDPSP